MRGTDEVKFGVLGPVRAWRGGAEVRLGPPQQRAVLVALLLRGGRPATAAELVDALWGENAPPGAISALRAYASRLRRVLEPERAARQGPGLVVSVAGGYALRVAQAASDLGVFEQRMARAKQLRAAGGTAEAGKLLHEALDAWSGTPLAGIPGPLAEAERARLDELRLNALETRIEVDLQLGQHAELVPELRVLCADHPLRERLCELLMEALYRGGRQAEALEAYRGARRKLVAELGIEPGPALREAHARLLAGNPAPAVPATAASAVPGRARHRTGGPTAASLPVRAADSGEDRRTGDRKPAERAGNREQEQAENRKPAGEQTGNRHREEGEAGASGAVPYAVPVPPPSQLPAALATFTGRLAELADARALLPDGRLPPTVVIGAIGGTAGIGKTALAVHWAHQIAHRFPDGQLYINLRGFDPGGAAVDPAEAIRTFLGALGVPPQRFPAGLDAQAALYRSLLARRRVLIVLDNARDTGQVRPLLPGTAGCLVIVTSRNQLPGLVAAEGAHPVTLDLLTPAEARELLARRIGHARTAAEPEAVEEIIELCARLPLALAIVAARAVTYPGFPLEAIAGELRESHGSLDAFTGSDAATDARAAFSWSYRALPPAAARLFRLLALHPGPEISAPAAAALAGLPLRDARLLLAGLTRAHLLTQRAPGRYTFHDLLRAYAAEVAGTLDTETDRRAALHRMFDHYLHTTHGLLTLFTPHRETIRVPEARPGSAPQAFTDQKQATAWLDTERRVLRAAVEQAVTTGFTTHAWQLAATLDLFFDRLGHWHDQHVIQRAALDAARSSGDRLGQAHAERALGFACLRLDRTQDAVRHLRSALDTYAELGEALGQARAHRSLAFLANRGGRHHDALGHYRHAHALYRASGYRAGEASVHNEVGWTYILLGEHKEALAQCARAIALHQELGDRNGEAAAQDSLGYALHHLGRHQQAIGCFARALALYRELGDRYLEADTLRHIGDTRRARGDRDAARTAWEEAMAILEEFGHPDAGQIQASLHRLDEPDEPDEPDEKDGNEEKDKAGKKGQEENAAGPDSP